MHTISNFNYFSSKAKLWLQRFGWHLIQILIGPLALLWVLIRIIPKPSRASYPCMKVAIPLASGFIGKILGIAILSKINHQIHLYSIKTKKLLPIALFTIFLVFSTILLLAPKSEAIYTFPTAYHEPNMPIGKPKGIFPGRVVWVHNPDATNENCNPTAKDHAWFMNENNNQEAIDLMLSLALQKLTGEKTDSAAWEAIFKFYNQNHGKGPVGYSPNEKIFIKINATSSWQGNFNPSDLSIVYNANYGIAETSPQLVLAVLHQLVNVVKVPERNIYIGDPMKHIYKHCYDLWHSEFPNIHYLDHDGYAGRENSKKARLIKSFTQIEELFYVPGHGRMHPQATLYMMITSTPFFRK